MEKFCPLKIGRVGDARLWFCDGSQCAWWDEGSKQCGITSIAIWLYHIATNFGP